MTRCTPHVMRRTAAAAVAAACAATAVPACDGAHHDAAPHVSRTGSTMPPMASMPVNVSARDAAVALRSNLEMALGDHVLLTIELMRDRLGHGPAARAQAAVAAVAGNTTSLSSAVTQLFGTEAGATFTELWTAHIRELGDYARALGETDPTAERTAKQDLSRTESDLGGFLSTATAGRLSPAAAQDAVAMHVRMLLDQADAYARGDYAASYRVENDALTHMLAVADSLASAIADAKHLPGALDTPRGQLQSALARLFAAHMGIVVEAMRSAADRAPDFASVGGTLNANTTAIGAAVGALYGHAAADAFLNLWAEHVDALVAYAEGVARHDEAAKAAAQRDLDDFATRLAAFLASATQQRLPAVQLTGALTEHDRQLTTALDAYAAGDFARAEQIAAMGYAHMFTLAETLAGAIGDTVAARLPRGGAQTGGGGTAGR